MSRYQKLTLFIGFSVLLLLTALILILAGQQSEPPPVAPGDQTATWAVDFAATHQKTLDAISTEAFRCIARGDCYTPTPG